MKPYFRFTPHSWAFPLFVGVSGYYIEVVFLCWSVSWQIFQYEEGNIVGLDGFADSVIDSWAREQGEQGIKIKSVRYTFGNGSQRAYEWTYNAQTGKFTKVER